MNENFITEVDICDEAQDNFLTYAEEVLTERAIPMAEDGLLDSQRKILWTMWEVLKMRKNKPEKKCAAVTGYTQSTSYYHGDAACYGVLRKLAAPYLMRYPLIDGIGSIGTQENNDWFPAPRYSNCKPSEYTELLMTNLEKEVIGRRPTYNNEYMEPIMLPSLLPNAIINGREAIGISIAHNSLPANLTEVCDAILYAIDNPEMNIDDIMRFIPGPDFPMGGQIVNRSVIKEAYETGKSKVSLRVRGDYKVEDNKIIFTSIPYRTYRNKIREQMKNKIDELSVYIEDFFDESNVGETKITFIVKKGADIKKALNCLFKNTSLETTLSYNMTFIVNGTPKLVSMKDLIFIYIDYQNRLLINAATFDKNKAEARLHIVKGFNLAINKLDAVIDLIRNAANKVEAKNGLIDLLSIDEEQADAILNMRLSQITKLDKDMLVKEENELNEKINKCNLVIYDEEHRKTVLKDLIKEMQKNYGDERRTIFLEEAVNSNEVPEKELHFTEDGMFVPIKDPKKETVDSIFSIGEEALKQYSYIIIATNNGYFKKTPVSEYLTSKRKVKAIKLKDDDFVKKVYLCSEDSDPLEITTNKGQFEINTRIIPPTGRYTTGKRISVLEKGDHIIW